jgi:hypothetical protein
MLIDETDGPLGEIHFWVHFVFLDKTYWNELGALMVGETGSDRHLVILMGEVGKHVTHIYIYFDVSKTRHVSLNNSCCTYSVVVRVN